MESYIVVFLVCLLIALAISGTIMLIVRSKLKSVHAKRTACDYTRNGSFRTTNQSDIFLYNNIVRIPRPQNNARKR